MTILIIFLKGTWLFKFNMTYKAVKDSFRHSMFQLQTYHQCQLSSTLVPFLTPPPRKFYYVLFLDHNQWHTGLTLVSELRNMPGRHQGPYVVPGIKPGPAICKAKNPIHYTISSAPEKLKFKNSSPGTEKRVQQAMWVQSLYMDSLGFKSGFSSWHCNVNTCPFNTTPPELTDLPL